MMDKFYRWLAWKLPTGLVMWAAVRLIAYATSGKYGNDVVGGVTCVDALKRWDAYREGNETINSNTVGETSESVLSPQTDEQAITENEQDSSGAYSERELKMLERQQYLGGVIEGFIERFERMAGRFPTWNELTESEESYPDKKDWFMCWVDGIAGGYRCICHYRGYGDWANSEGNLVTVTHWQALPPPPK